MDKLNIDLRVARTYGARPALLLALFRSLSVGGRVQRSLPLLQQDLGFSRQDLRVAIRALTGAGLVTVRSEGLPAVNHYLLTNVR